MSSETGIEQQDEDEFHPEDTLGWKVTLVAVIVFAVIVMAVF